MKKMLRFGFLIPLFALSLVLGGCGDDGKDGRQGLEGPAGDAGAPGADGSPGEDAFSLNFSEAHAFTQLLNASIEGIEVVDGKFTVNFEVSDLSDPSQVNAEFTIAKWVPAENSWIGMMQRNRIYADGATEVVRASNLRPGNVFGSNGAFSYTFNHDGADIDFSQGAYWTHSKPAVAAGDYGDYVQGILDAIETAGAWDATATYRIGVTSRQDERFTAVAYVDGTGQFVANPTADNALVSCLDCHGDRGNGQTAFNAHGNRRNDPQLCSSCHNNFTFDSYNSDATVNGWTPVDVMTMAHKIHAGIEGYNIAGDSYEDVRFPDWTFGRGTGPQNCAACHQTGNEALTSNDPMVCATCHGAGGFEFRESHTTNNWSNCVGCHPTLVPLQNADSYHGVADALADLATARLYTMEVVSVENAVADQQAQVTWRVAKDGVYQDLFTGSDTYLEDAVRLGIGWGVGEDWTNDGSGVSSNGDAGRPFQVTANGGNTVAGTDSTYAVTTFPALPVTATADRNGFAVVERGPAGISVSSALKTFTLGAGAATLGDRREIVSTESCLGCHGTVGRHGTTADTASGVTSCVTCHNAGSLSRTGSEVQGTVDFMYIMHAIHGVGEKREQFDRRYTHGYDYVTYPNTILDCNACHVGGSQDFPVDSTKRIGVEANSEVGKYSPMGSVCYSCHQITDDVQANRELIGHVNANGGDLLGTGVLFNDFDDYVNGAKVESCTFCHKH